MTDTSLVREMMTMIWRGENGQASGVRTHELCAAQGYHPLSCRTHQAADPSRGVRATGQGKDGQRALTQVGNSRRMQMMAKKKKPCGGRRGEGKLARQMRCCQLVCRSLRQAGTALDVQVSGATLLSWGEGQCSAIQPYCSSRRTRMVMEDAIRYTCRHAVNEKGRSVARLAGTWPQGPSKCTSQQVTATDCTSGLSPSPHNVGLQAAEDLAGADQGGHNGANACRQGLVGWVQGGPSRRGQVHAASHTSNPRATCRLNRSICSLQQCRWAQATHPPPSG